MSYLICVLSPRPNTITSYGYNKILYSKCSFICIELLIQQHLFSFRLLTATFTKVHINIATRLVCPRFNACSAHSNGRFTVFRGQSSSVRVFISGLKTGTTIYGNRPFESLTVQHECHLDAIQCSGRQDNRLSSSAIGTDIHVDIGFTLFSCQRTVSQIKIGLCIHSGKRDFQSAYIGKSLIATDSNHNLTQFMFESQVYSLSGSNCLGIIRIKQVYFGRVCLIIYRHG